ncbi:small integral membrane protein 35 isoform X1 [Passer domesticus]|uniref:small integral membrane protein 35 isoform X1 n=1 Tax=Passer domesticus TaxID=48849 RepID=UPI0030FEC324
MDPRAGQEPLKVIGVVLGIGLALLFLASFGYTFIRCLPLTAKQRGALTPLPPLPRASPGPDFVFSLYHSRGLGSVALELVPPFSISGSLGTSGTGYEPFHKQRP